jgi:glycosyltransferase involved in cell wall biosynthesis
VKIGYFSALAGLQAGGPETYDTRLARALAEIDRNNDYTIYSVNDAAIESYGIARENFRHHTLRPSSRWISIPVSLPVELLRRPVDVFHATYVPPPWFPGRLIYTLYDISMFTNPELFPLAIRTRLQVLVRRAVKRAEYLLTISHFSKQEIVRHMQVPEDRVIVTHLGVETNWSRMEDGQPLRAKLTEYGIQGPYILHVGRLQARKNLVRLVTAFGRLRKTAGIPHKLVLVGRESWEAAEIFETIRKLGLEEEVIHVGYAPRQDLPYFYSGADAVAFPSLYEGFGIPVVEAMSVGTPVVTSSTTSLPEVAGDAAELVDPHSADSISEGLERVLTDEGRRRVLRERGLLRASQFSWRNTALQTLKIYEKVFNQ